MTLMFRCLKCECSVGTTPEGGPAPCHWCDYLPKKRRDVAARRKLGHVVVGVDLDKALAAYRKLPPFTGNIGKIKLDVGHRMERGTCGRAWSTQRRIRIAAGPDATPERVLEVLVHEMVHLAVPNDVHHGERFRLVFRRACLELWGIDVPLNAPPRQGVIAYGMGDLATEALREKIARGEIETFPPDPKVEKPKTSRAELSAKLVEKRAAHAVKMMTRAEKRAKAAQKALARWRKKVNYYERQAARRAR